MLQNKLKRHFENNHGTLINKKRDYFVRHLEQLEKQTISFTKQINVNKTKALLTSYKVVFCVAQCKKPHTVAEELASAIDIISTKVLINGYKLIVHIKFFIIY